MADPLVSNSPTSINPDIPVRASTTAGGQEIQHVRLDLGVGVAESVAEGTVPVSAAALPLPAGAATAANQLPDGHNVTVDNGAGAAAVNIQDGGNTITVDGTVSANQAGTWNITNVSGTVSLPTGAATETTLAAINTKTPALGQAAMAASVPVAIANNQSNVPANIAQMNGVTVSMNTGVRDAGTQRVTIATNDVVPASQSGTWNIGTVTTVTTVGTVTNITNQGQIVDNAAFVDGTTRLNMAGFIFDEVAGTALTENDGAAARVNANRAQVMTIEDGAVRGRRATVNANNELLVAASEGAFKSIGHGSRTFPTAGSALALSATSIPMAHVDITANATNTGTIWIGGSGITAGNGRPLVPGQMFSIALGDLASVFGVSTVNGDGVSYVFFA